MSSPAPSSLPQAERPRPRHLSELFWSLTFLALQGFGGVLAVVQRELVEKVIQPVRVDGGRVLYCLREDAGYFDGAMPELEPISSATMT